jgi:large subunit ribosomal protein L6
VSRIGKKPVDLPKGVTVTVQAGRVRVKGPKGELERDVPLLVSLAVQGQLLEVKRDDESRQARSNHGLLRSLIQNMVVGVSAGYTAVLKIEGVGYRAELQGAKHLNFNVGFSKPIPFELPDGIKAELAEKGALITLSGIDKELLGQTCAKVRAIRPPEPYKGKGIRLTTETIRRKSGKAGAA